jgi:thiamine-monophosphate kinase
MLAGGDVTSGPLSITVTALGLVEQGQALLRSGAVAGDRVVVSGRPGAAAHALAALEQGETPFPEDLAALNYPVPRIALGRALRPLAGACIDISDGLSADLGHILEQSGVGAEVELEKLPCPESLAGLVPGERWPLQLAGGDDYELCFTLPPVAADRLAELARSGGVELTVIGTIRPEHGLVFRDRDGAAYEPPLQGYQHFQDRGNPGS